MKYYNYTDLGITASNKPVRNNLFIETDSDGTIYLVDSVDQTKIYKTIDKGENWVEIEDRDDIIIAAWKDLANDKIYFVDFDPLVSINVFYVDLTDDSINAVGAQIQEGSTTSDIWIRDGHLELYIRDDPGDPLDIKRWVTPNWVSQDTDVILGVESDVTIVGTDAYFWLDQNIGDVVMMKFDGANITELASSTDTGVGDVNQRVLIYDGDDLLYSVLKDTGDNKFYLWNYSILGNSWSKLGEYNVVIMADRNTLTGTKEKAYHLTEYKVYQLIENTTQLYLISTPDTGEVIIGITDNFFITTTGKMFEYEDYINSLISVHIYHEIMGNPYALVNLSKDEIPIEENMVMLFTSNYTSAGATAEGIIFEGKVKTFSQTPLQTIVLAGLGEADLESKPADTYTVDSDGLITTIITDDFNYITTGTLTDGADLGVITIDGDITSEFIFDIMAYFENFIWYLTPTGALYFNDGTVDTTENLSEASKVFHVKPIKIRPEYNKIRVKGAYIDGVQKTSGWIEDIPSQQIIGIKDKSLDTGFLDTDALCTTTATNLLTRLGTVPLTLKLDHQDASIGFMQPGETITFEFASEGIVIASDQFLIQSVVYNDQDIGYYTITSELI